MRRPPHPLIKYALAAVLLMTSFSCVSPETPLKTRTARLATLKLETSALIFIAEDRDMFNSNGIQVEYKFYDTGLGALNGLLKGEADLAAPVGEYAMVGKILDGERIKAIAAIDRVEYQVIVARKDRGIGIPSDLRGKKVGVIKNTQQEFYLTRFLELNGIKTTDVVLVNVSFANSVDAITRGEVDAIILNPPLSGEALDTLGSTAVSWMAQANQLTQQLMICRDEWLQDNAGYIERLLKSLNEAHEYLTNNPQACKEIIRKKLDLKDKDIARIWSQNQYGLSLDHSLIVAMEDETRWMIKNGLATGKSVPDFTGFVNEVPLKKVNPGAVNLIR
jgi:ABC-type nitrate/sulfonate/bicarbonate transport system substrate-binding protein